jgi:quercetin dioxygenase-like cupin family protein
MSGGPVWGTASEDLNATKLVWAAGEGPTSHVADRDVLYAVLEGTVMLTVGGTATELAAGEAVIVDKGAKRSLVAGADGVAYLTAHLRRGGLQIRNLT